MLPMTGYLPQGCRHRDIVGLSRANESSTAKSRKCTRQPITASHLWISAIDDRVGFRGKTARSSHQPNNDCRLEKLSSGRCQIVARLYA